MADEEVRVRVTQEAEGDAIAQTRKQIEDLRRAAEGYENKGMPEAARSARGEARGMEQQLNREAKERAQQEKTAQKEIARGDRERVQAERELARESRERLRGEREEQKVTNREQKERLAIERAEQQRMSVIGGVVTGAGAMGINTVMSGVDSIHSQIGQTRAQGVHMQIAARQSAFALRTGFGAEEFAAMERSLRDETEIQREEAAKLQDDLEKSERHRPMRVGQGALAGAASGAMLGSVLPGLGTVVGALAGGAVGAMGAWGYNKTIVSAEEEQMRTRKEAHDGRAKVTEKEQEEAAELKRRHLREQLDVKERIARGDMAGARAGQAALDVEREYQRLLKSGATNEDAGRGAQADFDAKMRQREQALGGLVTARTSGAQMARISSAADRMHTGMRDAVADRLGELRGDMNRNHANSVDEAWRKTFSRPNLR